MGFKFDSFFFLKELTVALRYIPVVLELALFPLLIGLVFGFLIACTNLFRIRFLSNILETFTVFIRGVPIVLQLTVIYLVYNAVTDSFAVRFGIIQKADGGGFFLVALIGLSLSATVNLSASIMTAFRSVDRGQLEASYSVGLTSTHALFRVIVPQAIPVSIPLIVNNLIGLIKNSSVASLIGVVEIVAATQMEAIETYKFLEGYFAAALVYWGLCTLIELGGKRLESAFNAQREMITHG